MVLGFDTDCKKIDFYLHDPVNVIIIDVIHHFELKYLVARESVAELILH